MKRSGESERHALAASARSACGAFALLVACAGASFALGRATATASARATARAPVAALAASAGATGGSAPTLSEAPVHGTIASESTASESTASDLTASESTASPVPALAASTRAADLLAEAETLYRSREWRGAEAAWQQALELELSDPVRGRVCRNLGNCAYRLGDLPRAVGWFEAARRLAPRDRDAWTNLELARRKLEWAPADRGDLRAGVERILRSFTANESEWLALLGLLPIAVCAGWEALRGGRGAKLAVLAALLVAMVCVAPLLHRVLATRAGECLVIAREGASLRAEPSDALAPIGRLDPGASAWRIDAWPEWVRVEAADGMRGWVPAAQLFELTR